MKYKLPPPDDWDLFEELATAVFSRRFAVPTLQRFGRKGQKQFGIDSVGLTTDGFLGLQCKVHNKAGILEKEVQQIVAKAETFQPALQVLRITTTAEKDALLHKQVLTLDKQRKKSDSFRVHIHFWDEMVDWLHDYPDVLRKYYRDILEIKEEASLTYAGINAPIRKTVSFALSAGSDSALQEKLRRRGAMLVERRNDAELAVLPNKSDKSSVTAAMRDALLHATGAEGRTNPYPLSIGLTTFPAFKPEKLVDLLIDWADLFGDAGSPAESFATASTALQDVHELLGNPKYSRELLVHTKCRLSPAFLFGRVFSKKAGYSLVLHVEGEALWGTSDGLPHTSPGIVEELPTFLHENSDEVVIVLGVGREIGEQVRRSFSRLGIRPRLVRSYGVAGQTIESAASARAIAIDLSQRIRETVDGGAFKQMHLFLACPVRLAILLGHFLGKTCDIKLYFCNGNRDYTLAGTCK